MNAPLTIVTAASENHFRPLMNFIASVRKNEPEAFLVVYDMGLTFHQHDLVFNALLDGDNHSLRPFIFSKFPEWMSIRDRGDIGHSAGCYAWKSVILNEASRTHPGLVLWCDAGNLLRRPLKEIRNELLEKGFYTPKSLHWVSRWTHPKTLELMEADTRPRFLMQANRNGAIIGFNTAVSGVMALLKRWERACLTKEIICPAGADITNHRFDQAILTVLAYEWERTNSHKLADVCAEIRVHCDNLTDEEVRKEIGL